MATNKLTEATQVTKKEEKMKSEIDTGFLPVASLKIHL